jgi:hypothetical protein
MFPFFELHDPSLRGGVASSGAAPRVAIVDGSPELEKWVLGLAVPPPGVLFLRGRDARTVRDDRLTCAVGAGYLPKLADVTLAAWVMRAAVEAERRGFGEGDLHALLDTLGLRFLSRTALAHVPEAVRPRASLAAALASNRPILVADASSGFATLDRDAAECAAWERWCAGREVILFLPRGAPRHVFEARGWVVVDEASPHGASELGWRVRASAESEDVAAALEAEGLRLVRDDGEVFVPRAEGATVPRIALALKHRGFRLREAALVPLPERPRSPAVEALGSAPGSVRPSTDRHGSG